MSNRNFITLHGKFFQSSRIFSDFCSKFHVFSHFLKLQVFPDFSTLNCQIPGFSATMHLKDIWPVDSSPFLMFHSTTLPSAATEISRSFFSPEWFSRSTHFNCHIGDECLPGQSLHVVIVMNYLVLARVQKFIDTIISLRTWISF